MSGSVLVVGASGALVSLLAGGVVLAGAVDARHRAESAADLAALAGAQALTAGGDGCAAAADVAARTGARVRCTVAGEDVLVDAAVALPGAAARLTGSPDAHARARAGPAG